MAGRAFAPPNLYVVTVVGVLLTAGEQVALLGSADMLFAYALELSFYANAAIASAGLAAAARAARMVACCGPFQATAINFGTKPCHHTEFHSRFTAIDVVANSPNHTR